MFTYGDYFSRKTLYCCGVSADTKLLIGSETGYAGANRKDKIYADMKEIYQTFLNGLTEKKVQDPKKEMETLNLESKIVSAFYDSGILTNAERDYFRAQSLENSVEREQINVMEANDCIALPKAQRVDAPTKTQVVRNVRS